MKLYYANVLTDSHGFVDRPYLSTHTHGYLTLEKAKEEEKFRVRQGGAILSFIEERDTETNKTEIRELKSYLKNKEFRRLHEVKEFLHQENKELIVYELNDDVWGSVIGKTLYNGTEKDCPEEIRKRCVFKIYNWVNKTGRDPLEIIIFKTDK